MRTASFRLSRTGVVNDMAVIHVIQTGSTLVSSAVPDRSTQKSEIAYTGLFQSRKKRIKVPDKAFLVEVSGHRILIDTGWSAECASHPLRHLGFGLWFASEPVMTEEEAVDHQLAKMGMEPSDIDAILLTHLDCDHASGLIPLKAAKAIYAAAEELDEKNLKDVRYNKNFWKGIDFTAYPMLPDENAPFGKSCDLYGDGRVIVYYTPSHSAGSVAITVSDHGRFALFTGDNGYNRHSWEDIALPGPIYDKDNMRKALEWVQQMSRKENCAGIYAAHDPEVPQGKYEI